MGSFSNNYANAQHDYFSKYANPDSLNISNIADIPEYAFNEYLHIWIELGLIGLLIFFLLYCFIIRESLRKNEIGIFASFISLLIFCFASYPLRLLPFIVYIITIIALVSSKYNKQIIIKSEYLLSLMLIVCFFVIVIKKDEYSEIGRAHV